MLDDFDENGLSIIAASLRRNFALPATKDNITAKGGSTVVTLSPINDTKPLMGTTTVTANYSRVSLSDLTAQRGKLRIVASDYTDFSSFAEAFHRYNAIVLSESDVNLAFPLELTKPGVTSLKLSANTDSLRFTGETDVRVFAQVSARLEFTVTVPALTAGKTINIGYVRSGTFPTPVLFDVYVGGVKTSPTFKLASSGLYFVSILTPQSVTAGELTLRVVSSIPFGTGTVLPTGGSTPKLITNLDYPISNIAEVTQDGVVDTQLGFINPTQQSAAIWIEEDAFQNNKMPIDISYLFANKNILEITPGLFDNQTIVAARRAFQGSRVMTIRAGAFANAVLSGAWEYAFAESSVIEIEEGAFPSSTEISTLYRMFYSCTDLTTVAADTVKHAAKTCTDMGGLFYGCKNLTSVPSTLFSGCDVVTTLYTAFSTSGLTTIPEGLLTDCISLTTVDGMFTSSSVKDIPANLFQTNTQLVSLNEAFSNTPIVSIPETLFATLNKLTTLSYCFMNCSDLTDIPDTLLINCVNLTSLDATFYGTRNVAKFPVGILKGLTKLSNLRSAFELCATNIRNSSPVLFTKEIMADCGNVTNASRAFLGGPFDAVEQGALDSLTKVTTLAYFFGGPSWSPSGAPLTTVPEDLFAKCTQLIEIAGFFASTGITTLPPNLFTKIPKRRQVKSLADMFYGCNGLTELPAGAFDGFTGVTDVSSMFRNARQITDLPDGLFLPFGGSLLNANFLFSGTGVRKLRFSYLGNCTALTSVTSICASCLSLTEVEAGALGTSKKLTNISSAFMDATLLTTVADAPLIQSDAINYGDSLFAGCSKLETIYPSWFSVSPVVLRLTNAFSRTGVKIVPKGLLVAKTTISNIASMFSECIEMTRIEAGWYAPPSGSGNVDMSSAFEKGAADVVLEDGSFPLGRGVKVTGLFALGDLTSPATGWAGIGGDISRFENAFSVPTGEHPSSYANMFATTTGIGNTQLSGKAKTLMTNLGLGQGEMSTIFKVNPNITWE